MQFIAIPVVIGIIAYTVYSIFDLFVRRKERLEIIDKLGDKFGLELLGNKLNLDFSRSSYGALKGGCLLAGLGIGLLVGLLIANYYFPVSSGEDWRLGEMRSLVYGSSVLLFGGLGLLSAFLLERKLSKKNKE